MTALPTIIPLVNIKVWEAFTLSQPPTVAFFWVIQCIKLVVGEDHIDERKHCDWLFSKVNQCTRRETERERKKKGACIFHHFNHLVSSVVPFTNCYQTCSWFEVAILAGEHSKNAALSLRQFEVLILPIWERTSLLSVGCSLWDVFKFSYLIVTHTIVRLRSH